MYKKLIGVMCVMVTCLAANAQRYHSIKPGTTWLDTNGKPIHAHSPQIFEKDGVYYWYGENKEHTEGLPERPVRNVLFDGVTGSCQNLITMADMEKVTFRNMTIEAEQQDIKQEATKQVQFVNVNITKK